MRGRKRELPERAQEPEPKVGGYSDSGAQELDAGQTRVLPELGNQETWELDGTQVQHGSEIK